ncbi:zinc finger protein STOP1 homolog [Phoenix dactylifera]|uniref:Zinc finger protein STOP1 homolog n=1 Tax=Phoenix dactylifera TaxID=42345 RepID=A0A8B7BMF7_PHODC|nr:zinc finger protein STOP1 homolog [Phoenix dactylifera]XP_017696850.2 zinc finger protein STOP1 homolog [Phoenix dactylifera]
MDHERMPSFEASSSTEDINSNPLFTQFDSKILSYGAGSEQSFPEYPQNLDSSSIWSSHTGKVVKPPDQAAPFANNQANPAVDWDPRSMLSKLIFIDQKIHQVQDIIRSTIDVEGQFSIRPNDLTVKQQLVTTDLAYIISQLISTTGYLLPSINNTLMSNIPPVAQMTGTIGSTSSLALNGILQQNKDFPWKTSKAMQHRDLIKSLTHTGDEGIKPVPINHHDAKDHKDSENGEDLPPSSYEVLEPKKEEILAPHTHFCSICRKGFKRSANLRMHMRGHGDEYKSPAALAKPSNEASSESMALKRYSCPFIGCKRNKEHEKFQPLKTILCVKNHYKRSHCDKSYTCSRCNTKKFSVLADLKTHEKHCGRHRWLCSCGTTFSRKDKLLGHFNLFPGHSPAISMGDVKASGVADQGRSNETMTEMGSLGSDFLGNAMDDVDDLDLEDADDDPGSFSPLNFGSFNFGGLDDIPQQSFDASESLFSYFPSGSCNGVQMNGDNSNLNHLG